MMHIFVGSAIFQLLKSTGMTTPIGKPFSSFSSIIAYLLFISVTIIGIQIIILIIKKNKFIFMVRRRLVTLVMRGAAPPLLSIINNRLSAKKL